MGRIGKTGRFQDWNERVDDGIPIIISFIFHLPRRHSVDSIPPPQFYYRQAVVTVRNSFNKAISVILFAMSVYLLTCDEHNVQNMGRRV